MAKKRKFGDLPPGNRYDAPPPPPPPPPPPRYDMPPYYYDHIPAMPAVPFKREKAKGIIVSNTVELADGTKQEQGRYRTLEHDLKPHMIVRAVMVSILLLIVSTGLEFFRLEFSFLPSFMELDFSIFPEFIALVFYGPIVGVAIVVLKNAAHMLLFYLLNGSVSYVGELSNLLTDIIFILIAFVVYNMITKGRRSYDLPRVVRIRGIIASGAISSAATAVIMVPIMQQLIYPLFVKYFAANGYTLDFLEFYQDKLPSIESVWQGLLVFNLPWEFSKLMCVTIIATIVYSIVTIKER